MNNDIGDIIDKRFVSKKMLNCDDNVVNKWGNFEYFDDLDVEPILNESIIPRIIMMYTKEEIILNDS